MSTLESKEQDNVEEDICEDLNAKNNEQKVETSQVTERTEEKTEAEKVAGDDAPSRDQSDTEKLQDCDENNPDSPNPQKKEQEGNVITDDRVPQENDSFIISDNQSSDLNKESISDTHRPSGDNLEDSSGDENDEPEIDDDGRCSRIRPYTPKSQRNCQTTNDQVHVELLEKRGEMPTPPDPEEKEEDDDSKHENSTPDHVKHNKCEQGVNPLETSKTDCLCSSPGLKQQQEVTPGRVECSESTRGNESRVGDGDLPSSNEDDLSIQQEHLNSNVILNNSKKVTAKDSSRAILLFPPDHKDKRLEAAETNNINNRPVINDNPILLSAGVKKDSSKIPVGIAVAWQRLVTSNSALQASSNCNTTTVSAPSTIKVHPTTNTTTPPLLMSQPKDRPPILQKSSCQPPVRPMSAAPASPNFIMGKLKEDRHKSRKDSSCSSDICVGGNKNAIPTKRHISVERSNQQQAMTAELSSSRPMPSASVPPNMGLSSCFQNTSLIDYSPYGPMRSMTPFPNPVHQNHHFPIPPIWLTTNPLGLLGPDLTVPQGFTASGAYMQPTMQSHLYLQQQLDHQLRNAFPGFTSPHSHYISSSAGHEALRHQYEQLIHQQQQSEYLRHLHQQQLLVGSPLCPMNERNPPTTFPTNNPRVSIPLLSPSPTGGIRTPTPNSGSSQHSHSVSFPTIPLSPAGLSPQTTLATWPADSYHHNSSTALLSPKSLTSSSPSPVTVQHHHYTDNTGVINTVAGNKKDTVVVGGNCSDSSSHHRRKRESTWHDVHTKKKHLSTSRDKERDLLDVKKEVATAYNASQPSHPTAKEQWKPESQIVNNDDVASGKRPTKCGVEEKIPQVKPVKKHDFRRLDSLIEKRGSQDDGEEEVLDKEREDGITKSKAMTGKMEINPEFVCGESEAEEDETPLCLSISTKNEIETDLNRNWKTTIHPMSVSVPLSPPLIRNKGDGSKKRKQPADDDVVKTGTMQKKMRPSEPKTQNDANENRPRSKQSPNTKKAPAFGERGESPEFPRKPCKIKPDINVNGDTPELLKIRKPKSKSKKVKEQEFNEPCFCTPLDLSGGEMKRNDVPEISLPVASSESDLSKGDSFNNKNSGRKSSDNVVVKHQIGLSSSIGDEGVSSITSNTTGKSTSQKKPQKRNKKEKDEDKVLNKTPQKRKSKVENDTKKSVKKEKSEKQKVKVEKAQGVKKSKKTVKIKAKETDGCITTPIAGGETQEALAANNGLPGSTELINPPPPVPQQLQISSSMQTSCITPLTVSYSQNSPTPVTLILPRIFPQQPTTITQNSSHQHQTSFQLITMSSSEGLKIPSFVPTQSTITTSIEGTTHVQTVQMVQQQSSFQQQNSTFKTECGISSSVTTTKSVVVTASGSKVENGRENTITFIRDSPISPVVEHTSTGSAISRLQNDLPLRRYSHGDCPPPPSPAHPLSPAVRSTVHSPLKEFISSSEDNHLNLLATVAQEFGSREDLSKLASSSSRGSSLMASPTLPLQSPEINFPTPSSSGGSRNTTISSSSASLPPTPLPVGKFTSSRSISCDDAAITNTDDGGPPPVKPSFTNSVWLKIPHVIPQAANKAAKKSKKRAEQKTKLDSSVKESKKKPSGGASKVKEEGNKKKVNIKTEKAAPKLKIPKIKKASSAVTEKPEKVKKSKKTKKEDQPGDTSVPDPKRTMESPPVKMKLPVPKIAKLKIKLPDDNKDSSPVKNGKEKVNKSRKNNEEKEKKSKKQKKPDVNRESKPLTLGNQPLIKFDNNNYSSSVLQEKSSTTKQYFDNDNNNTHTFISGKKVEGRDNSKPISAPAGTFGIPPSKEKASSPRNVFQSSFTPLTPPPTAKMPIFGQHSTTAFSSPTSSASASGSSVGILGKGGNHHETNRKTVLSWVSDPLFAASALRVNNNNNTTTEKPQQKHIIKYEMSSDEEDPEEVLMEYERRTAAKMRNEDEGLSTISAPFTTLFKGDGGGASKSSNSRAHHHIKPCLKPEPIVRPRSISSSSSSEDSDTDLEVASLTNSIPRIIASLSTPSQYKNDNSNTSTSNHDSSSSVNFLSQSPSKSNKKAAPGSQSKLDKSKRRRSSCTSPNKERQGGRRLSLNLETGRTRLHVNEDEEEEELLDIVSDYTTSNSYSSKKGTNNNKNNHHKGGRDNKKYRRMSTTSSASTSLRKMPMKRTSRSLTTSSSVVGGSRRPRGVSSSSRSSSRRKYQSSNSATSLNPADVQMDETLIPGKIKLESVDELKDEMRILTEIQGLFFTGKLNALQPPDVYGVSLDNERGARPHLIFSAEEVLEKCIKEKKPQSKTLSVGLRICAYWSPQYSGLYTGRVATDFNPNFDPERDLIPIEFDDGDTGMIKLQEIRLLPEHHPLREYDPNPLLTLEKKHRKRRHSSANTTGTGACTGDHEETDCGESFCAKLAKLEEEAGAEEDEEEEVTPAHSSKSLYWTWTGLGYKPKRSKNKKTKNMEFFKGIQRGDEVINVGDSAIFISHGNERPYIGRIEKFWERKGQKVVNVSWFYHPEEVQSPKRIPHLKHPGALFESPHIDENDVQTIAKKCDVLPYSEFKEKIGKIPKLLMKQSDPTKPRDLYYIAGFYDPYTYNLQMKI